jgi:hypothetical protein
MKIDSEELRKMFELAGIEKDALYKALIKTFPKGKGLVEPYRTEWSENNPTRGCCYFVSHLVGMVRDNPSEIQPHKLRLKGEKSAHWFLRRCGNEWIDLTAEQFGDDYDRKLSEDYKEGPQAWNERGKENPHARRLFRFYRAELGLPQITTKSVRLSQK